MCKWRREDRWELTNLPGTRVPGPAPLPPAPRPRLVLGVLPQLLLMTCSCRSARSARSRSSSMNCCSRSLALASRAAVSFRNWSICTTSLGPEQSLTLLPWPSCPATLWRRPWPEGSNMGTAAHWVYSWSRGYMQNRPRHPPSHNGTHRNACTYFKSHKTRHLCSPQKSLGITVTSSLQTHSRMYTITQPCTHSPIHSPMHSCTYTHITFIHRHTVGDRNSPNITFNHIRTHSTYIHTHSPTFY